MKKLMKLGSLVAFLFVIGLTFSSFTSPDAETANNGVIVEVVKGHVYTFLTGCADPVESTKSTTQRKNGKIHLITIMFDLPDGHCSIPDKNAYEAEISGFRVIFTPSGKKIAKMVNN